jgi:nicotinamide riboside kinase
MALASDQKAKVLVEVEEVLTVEIFVKEGFSNLVD